MLTVVRSRHSRYSHILGVVCNNAASVGVSTVILEDEVRSQILAIWECYWLQIMLQDGQW